MFLVKFFLVLAILGFVSAFDSNTHGASVQLFEWSWADIANECETFLGPKGFRGAQVSPPMEHIQGTQWWTRYQPVNYNNLVSRSGNETQFQNMITRCNNVGVNIIVDSVINHMAAGSGTGTAGSKYGGRSYPFFSPQDFHHFSYDLNSNCQVNNYNDKANVQNCDLVGLPDFNTASDYVQGQIAAYITKMFNMGAHGFRIDAAKHMDAGELTNIIKRFPASAFKGLEVIGASGEAVQPSQYYNSGAMISEFNYANQVASNIKVEGKMIYLNTLGETWGLIPENLACVFLDNHDTQRNGAPLTYKNGDLYTFSNIFMLAHPYGSSRIMSSYYFTNTDAGPPSVGVNNGANCMNGRDWVCEHRWGPIGNMVAWRNQAGGAPIANWQTGNGNQIAFSRNGKAFIAMNRGTSTWTATLNTGLAAGTYCNVISNDNVATCNTVTVSSTGQATVNVPALSAVALHFGKKK